MSRSKYQLNCADAQTACNAICNILNANGYKFAKRGAENVWKKGGFWTAGKYFRLDIANPNLVVLSVWIDAFGLSEQPIDNGFVGAVPKGEVKKVLNQIFATVR